MSDSAPRGVFLSYRREDTRHVAGRLFDRLGERFGPGNVFMDVDSIDPGLDFGEAIEIAVGRCQVVLALIGTGWVDVVDERGRRRLDDPDDLVVSEIVTAVRRGIRVIPVLVDGAAPPRQDELPASLAPLARRNAIRLDHETFRTDIDPLLRAVDDALRAASDDTPDDVAEEGAAQVPTGSETVVPATPVPALPRLSVGLAGMAFLCWGLLIDEPGLPSVVVGWSMGGIALAGLVAAVVERRRSRRWLTAVAVSCGWCAMIGIVSAVRDVVRPEALATLCVAVSNLLVFTSSGGLLPLAGLPVSHRFPRHGSLLVWSGVAAAGLGITFAVGLAGTPEAARVLQALVLYSVAVVLLVTAARREGHHVGPSAS